MSQAAIIGAGPHREGADRQARPVVHAEHRLDRKALEQPLLDHDPAAALVLLGRLEDEMDGAGEIAGLGEIARRAQQHRGMAVMAAGMHLAGDRRDMGEDVLLVDMERVHVGAQRDRTGAGVAPLEGADHAGAGEAAQRPRCRTPCSCAATKAAVSCSSKAVSGWA